VTFPSVSRAKGVDLLPRLLKPLLASARDLAPIVAVVAGRH
jgi:hypothetical protein